MSDSANHNSATVEAAVPAADPRANAGDTPASTEIEPIRHIYVHIPFCARICPHCAFYKTLMDRSQTQRFCQVILRDAGFSNINVDLMFGLPGQTREQWRATLEKTIALQPEHISAYCLTYEEDTEFFLRHSRGELCSNADIEADFFEATMSILEDAGYEHYEISNYARPGFSSVHNRAYWDGEDYVGIGPSAFSTG